MTMHNKCPTQDPLHDVKPLDFICKECGADYGILSDELVAKHHKCNQCGARIVAVSMARDERFSELIESALHMGLHDAQLLAVEQIPIEDRFRKFCEDPECPNYGSSIHCPPHSMTPAEFRDWAKSYIHVLAFKYDMPMEAISGDKRVEAGRLLHDTTAEMEKTAKSMGFGQARGFSSGGCKRTYCGEYIDCAALSEKGQCRFPDKARPSLSGLGVNWHELSKKLGWKMLKDEEGENDPQAETVMMSGLVFLD